MHLYEGYKSINKMMKYFIFSLFLISVFSLPNPAPYIHEKGRPLNIGHRGLSSLFPENTLEAFESALYQGADFV